MKGWAAAVALVAVVVAAGVGLWVTWDSTQTAATDPGAPPPDLVSTTVPPIGSGTQPSRRALSVPACTADSKPVAGDPADDWDGVVVDTATALPESFVPPDLVSVREAGFSARDQVRQIVIPDLAALRQAAEAAGAPIVVASAYRSFSYQQSLFDERAAQAGEAEAALRTARPGHSEHQLGTAVDVLTPAGGELTLEFASTAQGTWIAAHAYEYGFVLSYPPDSRDRTCYDYEPWHLRFVGRERAALIHDAGITPREWMLTNEHDQADSG
jgi:D-alanyl-D-alanine carboxypeptidase